MTICGFLGKRMNAKWFYRKRNGTRQMMWRVSDPEPVHALLGNIINRGDYPRHFSYEIVKNPEWEQTAFILGSW